MRGDAKFAVEMRATGMSLETPYRQAGVMDERILCSECEPKFTKWDTYGFEMLSATRPISDALMAPNGQPIAFELEDVDYNTLALFLLSVLWRASVSKIPFFKRVHLGPVYERRLREYLHANAAPAPGEHAIQLGTSFDNPYPTSILYPEEARDEDHVRFWRVFFPNSFAMIKMDQREAVPVVQQVMLQPRVFNYMICLPYSRSPFQPGFEGMKRQLNKLRLMGRIKN